jgi:hypothetical protein
MTVSRNHRRGCPLIAEGPRWADVDAEVSGRGGRTRVGEGGESAHLVGELADVAGSGAQKEVLGGLVSERDAGLANLAVGLVEEAAKGHLSGPAGSQDVGAAA